MSIKIGDTTIEKIYLGSTEIEKIYQGDTAIYEGDEPTPPTPPSYDFGERYYYTDGTYVDNNNITNGTLTEVNGGGIYGKTLSALTVGERVTAINDMIDSTGVWSALETLTITENVATIDNIEFSTYTPTIVFLGTTPPSFGSVYCYLEVDINVFVPQGCLIDYTTALNENLDGEGRFNITEASN